MNAKAVADLAKPLAKATPAAKRTQPQPQPQPIAKQDSGKALAPAKAASKPLPSAKAAVQSLAKTQPATGAKKSEPHEPGAAAADKGTAKVKAKLVRDSFTMPQRDFGLIAQLKDRALDFKRPTKKSELLRAGLHALDAMKPNELKLALEQLTPIKAGRPKNPT